MKSVPKRIRKRLGHALAQYLKGRKPPENIEHADIREAITKVNHGILWLQERNIPWKERVRIRKEMHVGNCQCCALSTALGVRCYGDAMDSTGLKLEDAVQYGFHPGSIEKNDSLATILTVFWKAAASL